MSSKKYSREAVMHREACAARRITGDENRDHPAQPPDAPRAGLPKGYDARKAIPLFDFLTKYFPLAIVEVTRIAVAGNAQHNPGEPLHWARGKSMDQLNTAMRHIFDHGMGTVYDTEPPEVEAAIGGKTMHLAKAAWRLLAEIQLLCEAREADAVREAEEDRRFGQPHHGHYPAPVMGVQDSRVPRAPKPLAPSGVPDPWRPPGAD